MFRLFFTYVLPLIVPALVYFLWLWAGRRRAPTAKASAPAPELSDVPWVLLAGAGVSLLAVTLLALALTGEHGTPGSKYVPPRFEGGKIVPGEYRQ